LVLSALQIQREAPDRVLLSFAVPDDRSRETGKAINYGIDR
jgi:hypothetical protein